MTTTNSAGVLAVMADVQRGIVPDMDSDDCAFLRGRLNEARAAVAELIEQRDALVGVLFELIQNLPKGPRSLSSNAQCAVRDGATLACAIFDKADVDPEAFSRYARTLWGTEYRSKPEELRARHVAALAALAGNGKEGGR